MGRRVVSSISALFIFALGAAAPQSPIGRYQSAFLRIEVASDQPAFVALAVDSLGKNKLSVSALRAPAAPQKTFALRRVGSTFEYRASATHDATPPAWTFEFSERQIRLRSHFARGNPPPPLVLNFDSALNHATLLGRMDDAGSVRLPAILHLPDQGTFRITSTDRERFGAWVRRLAARLTIPHPARHISRPAGDYVKVTFPAASAARPDIDYNLEVVAIYPGSPDLRSDARFDGFRRNWLNIFQLNPRLRVLANHAASDPCAFTLFEYSAMAVRTPPLAPGVTATGPDPPDSGPLPQRDEGLRHSGSAAGCPVRLPRFLSVVADRCLGLRSSHAG